MFDWIVAGLGNPGKRYALSRHNAGFRAVEALAARHDARFDRKHSHAEVCDLPLTSARVLLAKPQTWMNASGESVAELLRWHKVPPARLLVIYDEMDLPLGTLRVRENGSAGGHNGMKSIIQQLGTDAFPRLRLGVDRAAASREQWGGVEGSRGGSARERDDTIDHVLGPLAPADERDFVSLVLPAACDAVETIVSDGVVAAMNRYNSNIIPPPA